MSSSAAATVQRQTNPFPLLLGALGAAVIGFLIKSNSGSKSRGGKSKKYAGHVDVVSFSSRMIASARAMEMRQAEPLFEDPLAEVFAGPEAMARAEERRRNQDRETAEKGGPPAVERSRIAVRTRYFDDAILEALGAIDAVHQRPPWVPIPRGWSDKKPAQVVLLGAGMDSRAWRLKLPAGVSWFEVDRPDVMGAKLQLLRENEVQLEVRPQAPLVSSSSSNGPQYKHTLKADRYVSVSADLANPNWTDKLTQAGFDPTQATVWLAEGLLMYLSESEVKRLLSSARSISAKGSVFLASAVNEETVKNAKESKNELMRTWKWGCPDSPAEFLKALGWQQVSCVALGDPTASYGRFIRTEEDLKKPTRTYYLRSRVAAEDSAKK